MDYFYPPANSSSRFIVPSLPPPTFPPLPRKQPKQPKQPLFAFATIGLAGGQPGRHTGQDTLITARVENSGSRPGLVLLGRIKISTVTAATTTAAAAIASAGCFCLCF